MGPGGERVCFWKYVETLGKMGLGAHWVKVRGQESCQERTPTSLWPIRVEKARPHMGDQRYVS